jgi:citrate lyase subunit beta/citryl-CoA lyase
VSINEAIRNAATYLFVPGNRPERFERALAVGAGAVILDLEDAVAPEHKDDARAYVTEWVAAGNDCLVRVNASGTPWHTADLEAMSAQGCAVMLAKAENPDDVRRVAETVGEAGVVALIETARGLLDAPRIAAVPGVARLAFGSFDLAAELAVDPTDREALLGARTALVLASAAAGLPGPVDGVTAGIDNPAMVSDDARYGRRLGFTGKLCIHPKQLYALAEALRPTAEERVWAENVVAASAQSGVAVVNGEMVDRPVIDRAYRILRQFN